jgi:hypothetical protein
MSTPLLHLTKFPQYATLLNKLSAQAATPKINNASGQSFAATNRELNDLAMRLIQSAKRFSFDCVF